MEGDGRIQRLELELSKKTFRLGCSPVVNLFPQVAEPIQLDQRKYEYPVTPDVRRPYSMEVFSIDEVGAINSTNQKITTYEPFYSLRHSARKRIAPASGWPAGAPPPGPTTTARKCRFRWSICLLRMSTPDATVLSVRTTCTNRDLPSRLPFGNQDSDFEMEGAAAMKRIVALRKPTQPVRPELGKSALWRLVSHLSLNYLSLVEQGKDALQEILRLYDVGRTAYSQNVIQSILQIRSRPALHPPGLRTGSQLRPRTAHRDGARRRPVHRRRRIPLCQRPGTILRSRRLAEQLYPAQRHHSAKKGGTPRMATEIGPETAGLNRLDAAGRGARWRRVLL